MSVNMKSDYQREWFPLKDRLNMFLIHRLDNVNNKKYFDSLTDEQIVANIDHWKYLQEMAKEAGDDKRICLYKLIQSRSMMPAYCIENEKLENLRKHLCASEWHFDTEEFKGFDKTCHEKCLYCLTGHN